MREIFISHTHADKPIADLLRTLLDEVFGERVRINYSTNVTLRGGIGAGHDWFQWIVQQVKNADVSLILVTPSSVNKPWVIWEAGAVAGAAYAKSDDAGRVVPIVYGLRNSEIPGPLQRLQVVHGTDRPAIEKLIDEMFERFAPDFSGMEAYQRGGRRATALDTYHSALPPIIRTLAHAKSEATIEDWLDRLRRVRDERRYADAPALENWINVAFGLTDEAADTPLDARVHRLLGEIYERAGRARQAAHQYELARRLVPRDILVLRSLGKAHLDIGDIEKAGALVDEIRGLDPDAFTRNAENAAFKARWETARGRPADAEETLRIAYDEMTHSYYIADLYAQILIENEKENEAKKVYDAILRSDTLLWDNSVWSPAVRLTAALVLHKDDIFHSSLEALVKLDPSLGERKTIRRGIEAVTRLLGRDKRYIEEFDTRLSTG